MGGGREAMPQLETRKSQMGKLTGKAFGFDLWVGKIPWRRKQPSTPVFWPGEFHGLYSPWGRKGSHMTERLSLSLVSCTHLFPGGAVVKNPPANAGDSGDGGSVPRLGRSLGEGNGNTLQYSCLKNPMDR